MALTQEQIDKYGLSQVDGGSIDDGVIESGGNYYKLNNFERQQNDKLDTDQGDVFSSSLEADSGVDYSNFNTINDVQGAVRAMEGVATEEPEPVEYSQPLQEAHDRVDEWTKKNWDGSYSQEIFGNQTGNQSDDIFGKSVSEGGFDDANRQQKQAAQVFTNDYIKGLQRDISTSIDELK